MYLSHNGAQTQISDKLYVKAVAYMKRHDINADQFATLCGVSSYLLKKALNRKIKMSIYVTLIETIEKVVA